MHRNAYTRRPLVWGLVLTLGLVGVSIAQAQETVPVAGKARIDKSGALIVPLGGSVEFDPATNELITDIFNRNEDFLQVRPSVANPKMLVLTGRAPGLSQLRLTFANRGQAYYDVIVQTDYDLLRNVIKRTVPTASVDVIPGVGNVIILSGYVTRPEDADIILRIASGAVGGNVQNLINAMQVGGVQQVQIDVVVASVDRSKLRSRGFDFFIKGNDSQGGSFLSGLLGSPALGVAGPVQLTPSPDANLPFSARVVPTQFFGALRALQTEGITKFLAEPRVVTQTGRSASFLSGGRQAVIGPSSGINGPGVELVDFGTSLEVLPIVYGNNKIWLEVNPSITTVNNALGITTVFGTTPGFTEQSVRSAVMLESGQTFAIGGLIQNTVQSNAARVPVLGSIPYIGTAFSRVEHTEVENELLIMVTPRLVEPLDCNQVPRRLPGRETRSPDDYELFLEGILEAPRGQRQVWNGHCYNAAYKCDPTYGTFPCMGPVCTGGPNGAVAGPGCANGACAAPAGVAPAGAAPVMAPGVTPAPLPIPSSPAVPVPQATGAQVQPIAAPVVVTVPETVPGNPVVQPVPEPLPPQGSVAPGN